MHHNMIHLKTRPKFNNSATNHYIV